MIGNAMLGAIAGDIIGSRFEGQPPPAADFDLFHEHCRFTDDTVCTLAVAGALMGERDFAATLRRFVRRHPDRGYGGMFLSWAMTDGAPAYGSWGNGAPMRVAAVGWLTASEEQARADAAAQAKVSHDHPDAVRAAEAVALAILMARRGKDAAGIGAEIAGSYGYDLSPDQALAGGGFDVSANGTVPPALVAALTADTWEGAVRTVIGLGGDTDTLACIAGAVAEARFGLPETIATQARAHLTEDLETVLDRFLAAVEKT